MAADSSHVPSADLASAPRESSSIDPIPALRSAPPVGGPAAWGMMALVMIATFLVYLPSLNNRFVHWDDHVVLLQNENYRGLTWSHIRWMFATRLVAHFQPLTWLTFAVDYELWGLDPWGYHLTSMLFHAAAAGAFFWVARNVLHRAGGGHTAAYATALTLAAGVAALAFSIHPLRVESVAWATERRDVVSGLFFMLTLAAYLRASTRRGRARLAWLAGSLLAYALSLMGKATGMTLPFVLIVLDAYPLRRLGRFGRDWLAPAVRGVWLEKLPFLVIGVAAAVIAFLGQYHSGARTAIETFPWYASIAVALYASASYAYRTFVPIALSPLYAPDEPFNPFAWYFVLSAITVALATVGAIWAARRWPAGLVIWVIYLITLAPVSGLVKVGKQIAADRYTYLPCLVWAILVAAAWLATWRRREQSRDSRARFWAVSTVMVLAIIALAVLTQRQVRIWHDTSTLWAHAVRVHPDNIMARRFLVSWLNPRRKVDPLLLPTDARRDLRRDLRFAEANLRAAIAYRPKDPAFRVNLSKLLCETGRTEQAVKQLQTAMRYDPDNARLFVNLGAIYLTLGKVDRAMALFRRAIEIEPNSPARINLVNGYIQKKEYDQAVRACRAALETTPNDAAFYSLWGSALLSKGDPNAAVEPLRRAIEIDPRRTTARLGLVRVWTAQKRYRRAKELLAEGAALSDPDPRLMAELARFLLTCPDSTLRDPQEALTWAQRASSGALGRSVDYLELMAIALAANRRFDEAIVAGKRAIELARKGKQLDAANRLVQRVQVWERRRGSIH